MISIKNFLKLTPAKVLIVLISVSLIVYPDCSGSRIERINAPPDQLEPNQSSKDFPFLKLHMKNGDVYVLENWIVNAKNDTVNGKGKLLNPNRELISEGQFYVSIQQIVLAETNHIKGSAGSIVLATLSVITGIFTVVCITNPKACFGSCPTFYAHNGEEFIVQSEGFSSSVSPSLEEKDIDALYRIKPESKNFQIQLRNEAYETHVIRSANVLALKKPIDGRILATPEGDFVEAKNFTEPSEVVSPEGDCSEKLCSFDGIERFSAADSSDLTSKEIIEITFNQVPRGNKGLVIAARQTLLTTFLFYQTLAYMGNSAGEWLAKIERSGNESKKIIDHPGNLLGKIEVMIKNPVGKWEKINEVGETGPIATDIKVVPIKDYSTGPGSITLRLVMTKGLWRIDYVSLAQLGNKVTPVVIPPSTSSPQNVNGRDVIELLTNPDSVLITYPGDRYFVNYKLPENFSDYELFMESRGYYLEWMRNEWLAEENPAKVYQMFFNPKQFFKDLAPQFKKVEAEMEESFWSSKYVLP